MGIMMNVTGYIVENRQIAKDIYLLGVRLPSEFNLPVLPGQFSHIKIPNANEHILRRPISVNSYNQDTKIIQYVYQTRGAGTAKLAKAANGEAIEVIPALGKGFLMPESAQKVMLIGGGIGCAPLLYAAQYLKQCSYTAVLGFRDAEHAYQVDDFKGICENTLVCTDNGSLGTQGYVCGMAEQAIKETKPDIILACGPDIVLKLVKGLSEKYDIPAQLSMETRMGCGVGACVVCNVKIGTESNWHYKRCCKEGPVFDAKEVLFE